MCTVIEVIYLFKRISDAESGQYIISINEEHNWIMLHQMKQKKEKPTGITKENTKTANSGVKQADIRLNARIGSVDTAWWASGFH